MTKIYGMSIEDYRTWCIAFLDAGAEKFRLRFVTPGSGQALAYITKLQEAKEYIQAATDQATEEPTVNLAEFPHLVSEAPVDNMTLFQKASQIIAIAYQWSLISAQIDAMRLFRKQSIDVAETPAEMRALMTVDWDALLAQLTG